MERLGHYSGQAHALLHSLVTRDGIIASSVEADNYRRIWARDAIVAGIAGLLTRDEQLIEGLKSSLLTLANHQHELGMIPSNVATNSGDVSYGGLAGRIDASTWFVIGCSLYHLNTGDGELWSKTREQVARAFTFLRTVTFNDKGWIYTPLSGNWADEYPVHGYTLYDNCLYLWAISLMETIESPAHKRSAAILDRMRANFWPRPESTEDPYHTEAFQAALMAGTDHYSAFILPGHYDQRFDLAGNALALLLLHPDTQQKEHIGRFLEQLAVDTSTPLLPAFWPVIDREHPDWKLLESNYAYSFKNEPGNFHNGGIWPVWNGLFCLGLSYAGMEDQAEKLISAYTGLIDHSDNWAFNEYHNLYDLSPRGKTKMAYTASGILFMEASRSIRSVRSILFPDSPTSC